MEQTKSVVIGTNVKVDPQETNTIEVAPKNTGHSTITCPTDGNPAQTLAGTVPAHAEDISNKTQLDSVTLENATQQEGIDPTNPLSPATSIALSNNTVTPANKTLQEVMIPVDNSGKKTPMPKSPAHVTPTNCTLQGVTTTDSPVTTI